MLTRLNDRRCVLAQGFVPPNGYSIVRDLSGGRIAVMSSISLNAPGFVMRVYDVTNPLAPTLVSENQINQIFLSDVQVADVFRTGVHGWRSTRRNRVQLRVRGRDQHRPVRGGIRDLVGDQRADLVVGDGAESRVTGYLAVSIAPRGRS